MGTPKVCRFMKASQDRYTVREMAVVFGVRSSAYYKWAKKDVSREAEGSRCGTDTPDSGDCDTASHRYGRNYATTTANG
jgi:hypothetical protein